MFFSGWIGFGGGGSDHETFSGGKDEGGLGGPDFPRAFFPDAGS